MSRARPAVASLGVLALLSLAFLLPNRPPHRAARRVPWTAQHTAHADSVTACVGLRRVAPQALYHLDAPVGDTLGYVDGASDAVVVVTGPHYWPVFRHEVVHLALGRRDPGHTSPAWTHAGRCGFL